MMKMLVISILCLNSFNDKRKKKVYHHLGVVKGKPFFAFKDLLQRVEKIPSVQSLVATSNLPNICGAVMALGFILISL